MGSSTVKPRPWNVQGEAKRQSVKRMFSDIAGTYDLANSVMSLRSHHRWRAEAVAWIRVGEGEAALDVCCGTGDFLLPLRKAVGSTGRLVGLDFCPPMLAKAAEKPEHGASLMVGDACALPFGSGSFDAVTVGWGIRNVPDIDAAHREIYRVLRPGGRFVSIDMARPRSAAMGRVAETLFRKFVPLLGRLLGKAEAYRYLPESTERFLDRQQLADSMQRAGFESVEWRDRMFGTVCMHRGVRP